MKSQFSINVEKKALRKLKARENPVEVWFGLGMMGLVGWSVIVPTLIGTAIGAWLDKHYPGEHSWTLSLLVAGLCVGCLNAWLWVSKQHFDMQEKKEGDNKNE